MSALAEQLDQSEVVQEIATVVEAADGLTVQTTRGRYRAARAVSCLLEPRAEDTVLVAVASSGKAWVLAVLERVGDEGSVLAVEGDLHVKVGGEGRFQVSARGMDLVATEDATIATRRLDVHAREGAAFFDKLTYLGKLVHADVESVKSFVGLLDQVSERITQRVKRSYRYISELDITRSEQIDMRAKETLHMRGHNTLMAAEVLVKVDGEQIHLG